MPNFLNPYSKKSQRVKINFKFFYLNLIKYYLTKKNKKNITLIWNNSMPNFPFFQGDSQVNFINSSTINSEAINYYSTVGKYYFYFKAAFIVFLFTLLA